MRLILDCYPDGLVVALASQWGTGESVTAEVADEIEAATTPIPLPGTGLLAFHWQHPTDRPVPTACTELPARVRSAGP